MNIEQKKKTVVLRIMNLALMKFSLLSCGLKHTFFFTTEIFRMEDKKPAIAV